MVAEPAAMLPGQRRGIGKTDALDAVRIARSVLGVDSSRLRRLRAEGQRVALRVLVVAREQMTAERTRVINALTALLRTVDLGSMSVKPGAQPVQGHRFRRGRQEDPVAATCRQEAVRMAKRIVALDGELADNRRPSTSSSSRPRPSCASCPVSDRSSPQRC